MYARKIINHFHKLFVPRQGEGKSKKSIELNAISPLIYRKEFQFLISIDWKRFLLYRKSVHSIFVFVLSFFMIFFSFQPILWLLNASYAFSLYN